MWFSSGRPVSSTNKTDRHDITELLLKVALNTIKQKIIRQMFVQLSNFTCILLKFEEEENCVFNQRV
jgi:hypothetical protein